MANRGSHRPDRRLAEAAGLGGRGALIPFLENDDATNRALVGPIMQRQAVPADPCRRGAAGRHAGMEETVARDPSGAAIDCPPTAVSGTRSTARGSWSAPMKTLGYGSAHAAGRRSFTRLQKFQRSNQNTPHQPAPAGEGGGPGARSGDIIADGPSTQLGELALGRNVLVSVHAVEWLQLRGSRS